MRPAPAAEPGAGQLRHLVVIPAYNEEDCIERTVASFRDLPPEYELLVVNDGSLDRTADAAARASRTSARQVHTVDLPLNAGIGVAVQTGYLFAVKRGVYEYVIQCDADGQHDPAFIPTLVDECRARGLDLCVGSRFLATADPGYRSTFCRRLGIRFFSSLISRLSGVRVTDPTSGFRCAGPRAWRWFAEHYPDDYPEPESLFWCARNRFRVGEVPVRMRPRAGGVSSIRNWRTLYYMMKVSVAILVDRLRAKDN